MSTGDLDAVLAQLWAAFAPVVRARVDVVEAYAASLASGGDPGLRVEAAAAAHKLAGALGSYGRAGSDDASALELLLQGDDVPDEHLVTTHLAALRSATAA